MISGKDTSEVEPLSLRPRPSWRLGIYVVAAHLAALAAVVPLALRPELQILLALAVLLGFGYAIWAQVLGRAPWSVTGVTWGDGGIEICLRSGRCFPVRLSSSSYVGVGLVILNFNRGLFRRYSVVLTADNLDPDLLRRLRVRLRLIGTAAA